MTLSSEHDQGATLCSSARHHTRLLLLQAHSARAEPCATASRGPQRRPVNLRMCLERKPEEEVVISTSVPCSSLAMRRHGVRVNSNLRYPKNKWQLGGGSLCFWWGKS